MNIFRSANKMRIYSVYLNPRGKNIYENAMFISENFNFLAFLFTGFWALANRLWLVGIGVLVLQYGLLMLAQYCGVGIVGGVIIDVGIRVLIGLCGNDLWRLQMGLRGHVLSDVIVANNNLEAMHRYYVRHINNHSNINN